MKSKEHFPAETDFEKICKSSYAEWGGEEERKEIFRTEHLKFRYLEQVPVLEDVNLLLDGSATDIVGLYGG